MTISLYYGVNVQVSASCDAVCDVREGMSWASCVGPMPVPASTNRATVTPTRAPCATWRAAPASDPPAPKQDMNHQQEPGGK